MLLSVAVNQFSTWIAWIDRIFSWAFELNRRGLYSRSRLSVCTLYLPLDYLYSTYHADEKEEEKHLAVLHNAQSKLRDMLNEFKSAYQVSHGRV